MVVKGKSVPRYLTDGIWIPIPNSICTKTYEWIIIVRVKAIKFSLLFVNLPSVIMLVSARGAREKTIFCVFCKLKL